tara:strand:+ start:744 stop:1058 length:315 start_codon:yes stop_codon:yes gene_type:complete
MKLFKTFFLIIIVLFLIYFLGMNNARVDIDLLFKKINGVSISMVIFGALSLGVIIGYIIAVFSVLSSKAQNRKLQNKIKSLSDELNNLRNVAVNETVYEDDGLN